MADLASNQEGNMPDIQYRPAVFVLWRKMNQPDQEYILNLND
jgi:hypothetical protein